MNDERAASPIAPGDDSMVVFACKKCGHLFVRPTYKIGSLVACSKCHKTNKTVGIALQPRATPGQLRKIRGSATRLSVVLLILLALLILSVVMGLLAWSDAFFDVLLLVWGIVMLALLLTTTDAARHLGRSVAGVFILFFIVWPVFLVLAIVTLIRIRSRASGLSAAGTR